jgi:hypothetical protein
MYMSLEEVTVNAGHEVLVEVIDNSVLIVADLRGILGLTQSPYLIILLLC